MPYFVPVFYSTVLSLCRPCCSTLCQKLLHTLPITYHPCQHFIHNFNSMRQPTEFQFRYPNPHPPCTSPPVPSRPHQDLSATVGCHIHQRLLCGHTSHTVIALLYAPDDGKTISLFSYCPMIFSCLSHLSARNELTPFSGFVAQDLVRIEFIFISLRAPSFCLCFLYKLFYRSPTTYASYP